MRHFALFSAIAALAFGANATASPFSLTAAQKGERAQAQSDGSNLVQSVLSATAGAFDTIFARSERHEDDIVLRYYQRNEACPSKQAPESDTEADAKQGKLKKPAGPEPIYFGF